ncbi:MAG: outer membrane autotransporter protein [Rickettsiales bacterium]|jgi:outer membrane autotransporter protein
MINKKLLAGASLITSLFAFNSFAKTEGNYITFNALMSKSESQLEYASGSTPEKFDDSAVGIGVEYKYAFNVNNFFFAPGIFGEINNISTEKYAVETGSNGSNEQTLEIHDRYGLKADIGYDISDNFAIYLTGGASQTSYEFTYLDVNEPYQDSGSQLGYFYGAGLTFRFNKNVAVNFEYNTQSIDLEPEVDNITIQSDDKFTNDLQVFKLGISLSF